MRGEGRAVEVPDRSDSWFTARREDLTRQSRKQTEKKDKGSREDAENAERMEQKFDPGLKPIGQLTRAFVQTNERIVPGPTLAPCASISCNQVSANSGLGLLVILFAGSTPFGF